MQKILKHSMMLISGIAMAAMAQCALAEIKIGVLNSNQVLDQAPQAAAARQRLETEFSKRKQDAEERQARFVGSAEQFNKNAETLSPSERSRQEDNLRKEQREIKRIADELQEDYRKRDREEAAVLNRKISEAIDAVAKEGRYDLILSEGIIYASDAINVTDSVVNKLKTLR